LVGPNICETGTKLPVHGVLPVRGAIPVRGADRKYHVIGALGLIDRDSFKQLFSKAVPIFRAGGQNKKFIISPLCRYALENCCDDSTHCTNRGSNLTKTLTEGLANLETWIDDQAYLKRIRNFMVYNPNDFLSPDDTAVTKKDTKLYKMCWREGPVHMTSFGYERMATALTEAIMEGQFSRTGPATAAPAGGSTAANPRPESRSTSNTKKIDWSQRRQAWVTGSDTVVHRQYNENPRGRGIGKLRGDSLEASAESTEAVERNPIK
jgi:hypothetical protein